MLIGLVIYRLLIIFVPSIRARVLNARNRMVPREIAISVSNKVRITSHMMQKMRREEKKLIENIFPGGYW